MVVFSPVFLPELQLTLQLCELRASSFRGKIFRCPTTPLPALPPELWLIIFRLVTNSSAFVDPSRPPPLQDGLRSWDESRYFERVKLQRSIILVSKMWTKLAKPILYETVSIRRRKNFGNIMQTLGANSNLAQSIKRIDIGASLQYSSNSWLRDGECDIINLPFDSLFTICTNLRVLTFLTHEDILVLFRHIIPVVLQSRHQLRHISWLHEYNGISLEYFQGISRLPSRDLRCSRLTCSPPEWTGSPLAFPLPHLHTLKIYNTSFIMMRQPEHNTWIDWYVPSLRRLLILDSHISGNHSSPFLKKYGPDLCTLDLVESGYVDLPCFLRDCNALLELFINSLDEFYSDVEHVHRTLQRTHVKMFDDDESLLEFDRDYGIRTVDRWAQHLNGCMDALSCIKGPKLKSLRLLDFVPSSWSQHDWRPSQIRDFEKWISYWAKNNIVFEDSLGDPMKVPPYIDYDEWKGKHVAMPPDALVLYEHGQLGEFSDSDM